MTAAGWAASTWVVAGCFLIPAAIYLAAHLRIPKPPAGASATPPRESRDTAPSVREPLPGPRLPSLAPPAPSLDWVTDERLLQARCGCIHILDHVKRTRQRIPCEIHGFDVDEWERRLQL